jgi:tetratricopeptide (TPR) repeat protein
LDIGGPILDEIIKSSRKINHRPSLLAGLTWRGCLYFFQTEYERAIEIETEARQLASELRDGFLLLTSMFFIGLSLGNLGRMSEALATLKEGIRMAGRNGDHFWFPRMPNCIGWVHRELQDFSGAFEHDRQGLQTGRQYQVLEAEANSLINLAIDHSHAGDDKETVDAFHQTRDIFERDAWFRWRYNIRLEAATASHWLTKNNLTEARNYAVRLMDTAKQHGAHKYIAEAHRLMAQIAIAENDSGLAETEIQAALADLQTYPAPLVTWKTYAALGRMKSEQEDHEAAQEAFSRAAQIVDGIAANVNDEALRNTFLNSDAVREVTKGAGR